jgi:hypothetical protein
MGRVGLTTGGARQYATPRPSELCVPRRAAPLDPVGVRDVKRSAEALVTRTGLQGLSGHSPLLDDEHRDHRIVI